MQEKQSKQADSTSGADLFLAIIPVINVGRFSHVLDLPLPTKKNTYGYPPNGGPPCYSPIDLAVALTEVLNYTPFSIKNNIIKNLKEFFTIHSACMSEDEVIIGIMRNGKIENKTVAHWKARLCWLKGWKINDSEYTNLRKLLKDNAPLTFWDS